MKRLNISLTTPGSLQKAIEELQSYKLSLKTKAAIFIERLLAIGIRVAEENSGEYKGLIFYEPFVSSEFDCVGFLIASDKQKIVRQWYRGGQLVSAEVSPLLMAEFGSGWFSEVLFSISGVGQGTFPKQKHAFDEDGWTWTTPDGVRHYSMGETPTHPMHNASMALINNVTTIAREVFGSV